MKNFLRFLQPQLKIIRFINNKNNAYIYIYFIQYLKDKNAATPAIIQVSSSLSVASSKNITKLVLCPVVLNVPLLEVTLYNGQL